MNPAQRRKVYLLAYPAGHSVSPVMHQAAFDHLGLDADYRALEVTPDALQATIAGFREATEFMGANVTVPHKRAVMPLLDELSSDAASIGAVNTITRSAGRLVGSNTDAAGFSRAFAELWPVASREPGAEVLLLGAGGSARAVAWALAHEGLRVGISARRPAAAVELVEDLKQVMRYASGSLTAIAEGEAADWLERCHALVNSTPVGMVGGAAPAASPAPGPLVYMRPDAVVYDLVYRPALTPLLAEAAALDLRLANGLSMLVWQGALSFSTWTAREAPVAVMAAAAGAALGRASPVEASDET